MYAKQRQKHSWLRNAEVNKVLPQRTPLVFSHSTRLNNFQIQVSTMTGLNRIPTLQMAS
ncbi:hypothetical protein GW17_00025263 [Ensete ventricosum]|nr:hypothetical protein GW17_00025263 [Ensete ventricosum]